MIHRTLSGFYAFTEDLTMTEPEGLNQLPTGMVQDNDSWDNGFPKHLETKQLDPIIQSKRHFRGNVNYVNFYNRHVVDTIDGMSLESKWLKPSRNTHDGKVYVGKTFSGPGSRWTSQEKDKFFTFLGRYSIHQVDLIQSKIPTKSTIEILAYYNLLDQELRRIKQTYTRKTFKYKVVEGGHKSKREIRLRRIRLKLLRYEELPIAYEVSETMIKFEEEQSRLIGLRERFSVIDKGRYFIKAAQQYAEGDHTLFHGNELTLLSKNLFVKNGITEYYRLGPSLIRLDFRTTVFLEDLVVQVLRKIMYRIIALAKFVEGEADEIDKLAVDRAISALGYNDPEMYFNKVTYLSRIKPRLLVEIKGPNDIMLGEDEAEKKVRLWRFPDDETYHPYMKWKKYTPKIQYDSPFQQEEVKTESNVIHILQMYQKPHRADSDDHGPDWDLLEEEMNEVETKRLEKADGYDSRMHERGLLTMYATENCDRLVNHIYSVEEGEEVLKYWKDQAKQNHGDVRQFFEESEKRSRELEMSDAGEILFLLESLDPEESHNIEKIIEEQKTRLQQSQIPDTQLSQIDPQFFGAEALKSLQIDPQLSQLSTQLTSQVDTQVSDGQSYFDSSQIDGTQHSFDELQMSLPDQLQTDNLDSQNDNSLLSHLPRVKISKELAKYSQYLFAEYGKEHISE